jgi:hypothetical protein
MMGLDIGQHPQHLLLRPHQRIDVFERPVVGILRGRGAGDGVERLSRRIGDKVEMEKPGLGGVHG